MGEVRCNETSIRKREGQVCVLLNIPNSIFDYKLLPGPKTFGPKTLFLDRYYFHRRVCVCLSVCLSVSLYIDYLKILLTDFDET